MTGVEVVHNEPRGFFLVYLLVCSSVCNALCAGVGGIMTYPLEPCTKQCGVFFNVTSQRCKSKQHHFWCFQVEKLLTVHRYITSNVSTLASKKQAQIFLAALNLNAVFIFHIYTKRACIVDRYRHCVVK